MNQPNWEDKILVFFKQGDQSAIAFGCFGGQGNSVLSFSNYTSIPSSWK
jgi:hypothetical protein